MDREGKRKDKKHNMTTTSTEYNLTSAQVAKKFDVTQKTVIRWTNNGRFNCAKVSTTKGLRYRFAEDEIEKALIKAKKENWEVGKNAFIQQEENNANYKKEEKSPGEGVISEKFTAKLEQKAPAQEGERGMTAQAHTSAGSHTNTEIYKELYQEKEKEVQNLNEKLHHASYRMAQLEEQVKTRIPLIEHNVDMKQLEMQNKEVSAEIKALSKRLEKEKIINISFFILSGLIIMEIMIYLLA